MRGSQPAAINFFLSTSCRKDPSKSGSPVHSTSCLKLVPVNPMKESPLNSCTACNHLCWSSFRRWTSSRITSGNILLKMISRLRFASDFGDRCRASRAVYVKRTAGLVTTSITLDSSLRVAVIIFLTFNICSNCSRVSALGVSISTGSPARRIICSAISVLPLPVGDTSRPDFKNSMSYAIILSRSRVNFFRTEKKEFVAFF